MATTPKEPNKSPQPEAVAPKPKPIVPDIKEPTPVKEGDPVSLIGPPADVPQPQPREITIGEVKEEPKAAPSTTACEVTRDDDTRTITIK